MFEYISDIWGCRDVRDARFTSSTSVGSVQLTCDAKTYNWRMDTKVVRRASMQFIILGTDHDLQCENQGLMNLVIEIIRREQVRFVAEENRPLLETIARRVSSSLALKYIQIDMSVEDRIKAGIDAKLHGRMQVRYDSNGNVTLANRYAQREDGVREEFWLDRIQDAADEGVVLVICGCSHCVPLAEKAERRGHTVLSKIFHPEELSELKPEFF